MSSINSKLQHQLQATNRKQSCRNGRKARHASSATYPAQSSESSSESAHSAPLQLVQDPDVSLREGQYSCTGGPASTSPQSLGPVDDLLVLLEDTQQEKDKLQAHMGLLSQQLASAALEKEQLSMQLKQLAAEPEALQPLSLAGLQEVEAKLDRALHMTREAVLQRRIAEVEQRALSETHCCSLCLERRRAMVFNCGHQTCIKCSEKLPACPFCRAPITAKIKMFDL